MSIYDNETTSKIYSDLNLTAPQEPQTYRLKKLTKTSLLVFLVTVITQKSSKPFTVKQEKHDAIKLLAQSKLDSIANSPVMQDGDIH